MVDNPFTSEARVNTHRLRETVALGVRFLDNVLDVTKYPLHEQEVEAQAKRRLGLGITGLANMLQQLMIRYGSDESADRVGWVMSVIKNQAYRTSVELSKERGPFLAFEKEAYLSTPFIQRLPADVRQGIAQYGIRNGVLLTVAPTGTTSIYYDNVSSGIEPTFSFSYLRNVKTQAGDTVQYEVEDYGYKHFRDEVLGGRKPNGEGLPSYMVTALELSVDEHLKIQAVCQEHVDASISKTINCPKDISFEDFKHVYDNAYSLGLKGCTTYRDTGTRGNVLSVAPSESSVVEHMGSECPSCGEMALVNQEGCEQCFACGFGKCSI
jgi:ribonucleoside-diphosphate reductase alpha chain